jgi:hypothetical protein
LSLSEVRARIKKLQNQVDALKRVPVPASPLAEREQQIAELDRENRLQRTEEAIVVATGAPRDRGCPAWVVLGVKAVEARGIRAA